jgi:hypothetical protein
MLVSWNFSLKDLQTILVGGRKIYSSGSVHSGHYNEPDSRQYNLDQKKIQAALSENSG